MRRIFGFWLLMVVPFAAIAVVGAQYAQPTPPGQPAWAYGISVPPPPGSKPDLPPAAEDKTQYTLPGTNKSFLRSQISDPFGPVDWYPNDHPPMPDIVAKGRKVGATVNDSIRACGLCHMPNGKGRMENSSVSGLPVEYFIKQMNDFKHDLRKTSEPRKANAFIMINIAKAMTDDEIKAAAEYFAAIKWTGRYIRVVEGNTIPKTRVQNGVHFVLEGAAAGTEPLGQRIVETPEHNEHFEILRDPRDGFVAYVPAGSIKKGEALVKTGGNGKTVACGICHGADLLGMGPVPPIAGRSPSMLARQMWDMKQGTRKGTWAELMKPVVQNLTNEDLVNILAYTASRPLSGSSTN